MSNGYHGAGESPRPSSAHLRLSGRAQVFPRAFVRELSAAPRQQGPPLCPCVALCRAIPQEALEASPHDCRVLSSPGVCSPSVTTSTTPSLHGKPIGTKVLGSVTDQKWASHVGTGLAFLTKFFFTATARRPLGLSVAGLNASFGILNNPLNFLSTDLLFSAQFLLLLALISWLVPIVTVFTPGALTVSSEFVNGTTTCQIPSLDLASKAAADRLGSYHVNAHTQTGELQDSSQLLHRWATQTLMSGTYITPPSPCAADASLCTYSTSYIAPYLDCGAPVVTVYQQDLNFKQIAGVTRFNATFYPGKTTGDQLVVAWLPLSSSWDDTRAVVLNGPLNTDINNLVFQTAPLSDDKNTDATRSQILSAAVLRALNSTIGGSIWDADSSFQAQVTFVDSTMAGMSQLYPYNNFTVADDVQGLIGSLMRNITIGLMGQNVTSSAVAATCVESRTQNIYVYNAITLWGPYCRGRRVRAVRRARWAGGAVGEPDAHLTRTLRR
ncbi:hypothetical protein C8J57DRAFT_1219481 [Mycena rebaudengoi]|nr:hypothetical protein C8J57DRAFT_1219481 [Mycena rebaudengoi]